MNSILAIQKSNTQSSSRVVNRILLLLIGCIILLQAQSQVDKNLALADKYFAAGDYFTAAGLYEQFLNPPVKQKMPTGFPLNGRKNSQGLAGSQVSKADILYKQAESYRLANYWLEASDRYKKCLEKDPAKYASGLYWYAVANRSMGSYAIAEESINLFLQAYSEHNPYQDAAAKELDILRFIKSQLARPDSVLYNIKKINTSFGTQKGVYAPVSMMDNQLLITSTQSDSVVKAGINPFHSRLFSVSLSDGGLQNMQPVTIDAVDVSLNQGAASISADGNYLYFTQWKKENGQTISSVYYARKNDNGWSTPALLPLVNLESFNSKQPFCSADGKYLFFACDRPGGYGQFDIWYAVIQQDGTTAEPINAGAALNTAVNEQAPFYHNNSNTLVFSSDRVPGMGGFDLFSANGKETQWNTPENMGHPVNSSRDDLYFFASEKETLLSNAIISSDRGSDCCLETYTVTKTPKNKMFAGVVRDCKDNEPVADAGVVMKDASGKSWRTTTGPDGKYAFELTGDLNQRLLSITKEKYKDHTTDIAVERKNESGWLTDTSFNGVLCIEKKLVIKVENVVSVYFDFDKSDLKDRGIAQLDSIYTVLVENNTATIQISGYTDGRGSVEYNKVLSDKRAKACADYLIQKGIDSSRVSFESFGACCPVEMELLNGRDNAEGRSKNRRALINISKE
jgi:OmpA-OmpF porin, OOP family